MSAFLGIILLLFVVVGMMLVSGNPQRRGDRFLVAGLWVSGILFFIVVLELRTAGGG